MKEVIDKLSTYNIFNYLLPGTIFSFIIDSYTNHKMIIENIFVSIFVYYFIGLLISRIGSLFLEPLLKKIKVLKFASYDEFVQASKVDEKINLLSEINNMYRTLSSTILCVILVFIYDKIVSIFPNIIIPPIIILIFLFVLFIFSYRKQTDYISKRIKNHKKVNVGITRDKEVDQ